MLDGHTTYGFDLWNQCPSIILVQGNATSSTVSWPARLPSIAIELGGLFTGQQLEYGEQLEQGELPLQDASESAVQQTVPSAG